MKSNRLVRTALIATVAALGLSGCSSNSTDAKAVEVEMQEVSGEWSPVITVHGYYDNRAAAADVVRGLKLVSAADGHEPRLYRVSP
jgi:ABC-type glycerol-3-phosphate transport system substrate-binding protein